MFGVIDVLVRLGVKNIQRGALKFLAKGCKTMTPPKNSSTDMYPPPLKLSATVKTPPKFLYQDMDPP